MPQLANAQFDRPAGRNTGRLFLSFGSQSAPTGLAIVHWLGCINAIKINFVYFIKSRKKKHHNENTTTILNNYWKNLAICKALCNIVTHVSFTSQFMDLLLSTSLK